jgi:flagellar basal body-associated protein FliL
MSESAWLDHQQKRKNYLWLVLIIAAVCIAAALFIRNNSEIIGDSLGQKKAVPVAGIAQTPAPVAVAAAKPAAVPATSAVVPPQNASHAITVQTVKKEQPVAAKPQPAQGVKSVSPQTPAAKAAETVRGSVPLTGITCRLIDKSQPLVRLSLLLVFPANKALEQEVLLKRDNLKIMVQKTLATKSIDDMVIDALRKDILSVLNQLLENGALSDIEFKEFRIDKVE